MATPTLCRACGGRHDPMLTCQRAARLAAEAPAKSVTNSPGQRHKPPARNKPPAADAAIGNPPFSAAGVKKKPGRPKAAKPTAQALRMRASRERKAARGAAA